MMQESAIEPSKRKTIADMGQRFTARPRGQESRWMDIDAAVASYCRKAHLSMPGNIEEKMLIHIRAIEAWTHIIQGGEDEEVKETESTQGSLR